jgi:hypothetical protein
MDRPANPNPSYLRHGQSGQARVVVRDHLGGRKEILLAPADPWRDHYRPLGPLTGPSSLRMVPVPL